jgi:hypothetical protein
VLFTIENTSKHRFNYEKNYSIQHGFDYVVHGEKADSKTVYICHSEASGLDLQLKYKLNYIIPPIPVAFSNLKIQIDYAKKLIKSNKDIIFIFFPERSSVKLIKSIIKYLKKRNFYIIVKQRRKNQRVPKRIGADLIVYDDIWYPSESIFYPLISKFVIGFGTTAYIDLCEIGINFIDNAITPYSKKGGVYLKPNLKNFWYIEDDFYKNTINIIDANTSKGNNIKNIPENLIKKFYIDLLKN